MSDKMNSIKFLSSIRAPQITADKLYVKGDLNVDGAITTTNYEETIIKDAFQIFNSGNSVGEQYGEIILTGNGEYACSECAHFSYDPTILVECINQLIEIHVPEAPQEATYLWNTQIQSYSYPYLPYYMTMRIRKTFHNEDWYYSIELEDDFDHTYKTVFSAHQNVFTNKIIGDYPVYEDTYDSEGNPLKKVYLDQVRIFGVGGADIPVFNRMIEIDASASMQHPQIYSYAYGIIYDSELDSVRLGEGMYTTDWDTGNKQFSFNAGEGLPLAIRDLTDDDNGRLVKWDAERHCLVRANSEDYVIASSIEEGTDGYFDIQTASGASEARIGLYTKVLGGSDANVEINATEADSRVQIVANNIGLQGNATLNDQKILTEGDIAETEHQVSVTWAELVSLRDNAELIPGMFYRITDYKCTTSQKNTRAVNSCRFDIIVQALDVNILSENASAVAHNGINIPIRYRIPVGTYANDGGAAFEIYSLDYKTNNNGVTVPVLRGVQPEEPGAMGDDAYYEGIFELDGEIYDRWIVIESQWGDATNFSTWDSTCKEHILTTRVVENNAFTTTNIDDIEVCYVFYDDMDRIYSSEETLDTIVEVNYLTEKDGAVIPVLYKTDMTRFPDEPDYGEPLKYVGRIVFDGVEYDKWEQTCWDSNAGMNVVYAHWLTDIVVDEDGKFTNVIYTTPDINFAAWELKYCIDSDNTRFTWSGECNSIFHEGIWYNFEAPFVLNDVGTTVQVWRADADPRYNNGVELYLSTGSRNPVPGDRAEFVTIVEGVCDLALVQSDDVEAVESLDRGAIYYMKDEWNNECPYDFKNIQFIRPIAFKDGYPIYDEENGANTWLYTFTAYDADNNEWLDASVITGRDAIDDSTQQCYGNKIDASVQDTITGSAPTMLNNNVFINCFRLSTDEYYYCYGNTLNDNCQDNTFGDSCFYNALGGDCSYNTFGDSCSYNALGAVCVWNTFGQACLGNTFGDGCNYNTFGVACSNNTIHDDCLYNALGNECSDNTFGNKCHDNTFGNYCFSNTFSNECHENTFGDSCYSNTFNNECHDNTFGESCYSNTFGHRCSSNTFVNNYQYNSLGNDCYSNTFGNDCQYTTFGNDCHDNTFGNNCSTYTFGNDCYANTFSNGCTNNAFGKECHDNELINNASYNKFSNNCSNNLLSDAEHNIFGDLCNNNRLSTGVDFNTFGNGCTGNNMGAHADYNIFGNNCQDCNMYGWSNYNVFGDGVKNIKLDNRSDYNTIGKNCSQISLGCNESSLPKRDGYFRNVCIGDGCKNLNIFTTAPDSSVYAEYITLSPGIVGPTDRLTLTVERGGAPVVFEAPNTTHIILD